MVKTRQPPQKANLQRDLGLEWLKIATKGFNKMILFKDNATFHKDTTTMREVKTRLQEVKPNLQVVEPDLQKGKPDLQEVKPAMLCDLTAMFNKVPALPK